MILLTFGCGRQRHGSAPRSYEIPNKLKTPPKTSPVPSGSLEVVALPEPGGFGPLILVHLLSEPDATIQYGFRAPEKGDNHLESGLIYEEPLQLRPPLTLYAQASAGDKVGPVRDFSFDLDPGATDLGDPLEWGRPPYPLPELIPFPGQTESTPFSPTEGFDSKTITLDGNGSDWPDANTSRDHAIDGTGDVPISMSHIDLTRIQIMETETTLQVLLEPKGDPWAHPKIAYGFEIGPSNISEKTFGPGTEFHYRVETVAGELRLVGRKDGKKLKTSEPSKVVLGKVVEIQIAKSDLPLIAEKSELVLRAYSTDWRSGPAVFDKMEPFLIRSSFGLTRHSFNLAGGRPVQIDFLASSASSPTLKSMPVANDYLAIAKAVLSELEGFTRIPFYNVGTFPMFYVPKEESGYAGLNTTDRGILTTVGATRSIIAKVQLFAHEFAHYQNARYSELGPRWLQEGMSEWAAERLLYRHFPPKAVYNFMRKLRYDRYAQATGGDLDREPLANWGEEVSTLGYEKSLMFINLLEARLGQQALRSAFKQAVNEPTDSQAFLSYLEHITNEDLSSLVPFWLEEGDPAPDADPRKLYVDEDADGLLTIDELILGLNPRHHDTDGDGFGDGEEYFRGGNPHEHRSGDPDAHAPATLANQQDPTTSALFRLAAHPSTSLKYSPLFVPADEMQPYSGPLCLRPPYRVYVETETSGGTSRTSRVLSRPLFVKGREIKPELPGEAILPATPKNSTSLVDQDITFGAGLGSAQNQLIYKDAAGDLPEFLSDMDITSIQVANQDDRFQITIETVATPTGFGEYGDTVVTFDTTSWDEFGATLERRYALTLTQGNLYLHVYQGSDDQAILLEDGFEITYDQGIRITIDQDKISEWMASSDERQVCIWNQIILEGDRRFKDRAGCLVLGEVDDRRVAGQLSDFFGIGHHQMDLFIEPSSYDESRRDQVLATGLTAIRHFESLLGRPLLDRSVWPLHLAATASGTAVVGSASLRTGAYLNAPSTITLDPVGHVYLVVEQLARLHMADVIDRTDRSPPYWIQELYIQWLTASAMYRMYPTSSVHEFHARRIDDYLCFAENHYQNGNNGCLTLYSSDVALADWNLSTLGSTGSVKSLALMLMLDAMVGADAMAEALSPFTNHIPTSHELKRMLVAARPDLESHIEQLWTVFVEGSGNQAADTDQILQRLDVGASGLFRFEEDKLNALGTDTATYLQ